MSAPRVEIGPVGSDGARALEVFLASDPVKNLFVIGVLEEHGATGRAGGPPIQFVALRAGGAIDAVAFVGGYGALVVPAAGSPAAAEALGRFLRATGTVVRRAVGERAAVDALWAGAQGGAARLFRAQRLYKLTADDLGPQVLPELRLANEQDLDALVAASAAMQKEDLGEDPLASDPDGFARRVLWRVRAGRTYLVRRGGKVVFKVDIGTLCRHGAQIEGVWTDPAERGKGVATLGVGQICRTLLARLPRITLHVNEANQAAVRVYEKVGFVPAAPFRVALAEGA